MARSGGSEPARRILARAGLRRLRSAIRTQPLVVRVEIGLFAVLAMALLAYHADQSYYGFSPDEPGATSVTHASRILFALLLVVSAFLADLVPRLTHQAADRAFLDVLPVPERERTAWTQSLFTAATLPLAVPAVGLLLPPLRFGEGWTTAAALLVFAAWLAFAARAVALLAYWIPVRRWGASAVGRRLGRLAHFLAVPLVGVLYYAARETSALILDPREAPSLVLTAAIGALLARLAGALGRAASGRSRHTRLRLAEQLEVTAWRRRRRRWRAGTRFGAGRLLAGGAFRAWVAKELLVGLRSRALRWQWFLWLALKLAALVLAFTSAEPPWVFCGLLLVLSDLVAGVAILLQWSAELPGWSWGSPSGRLVQWSARAVPVLAVSLAASGALALRALANAGGEVARPLALWTVVAGLSLVVAAANLGSAAPPRSSLGQNLYALGLFSSFLVGAVFPVIGWAALAAFALYTFRAPARDPRP